MQKKTTLHYYKTGSLRKLELALDAASREGWQAVKPGRLLQHFVYDDKESYLYRLGVREARDGSAADITYLAEHERAGWELAAKKGCWMLFRKKAADADEDEALPEGREDVEALFDRRIKVREKIRQWMIVLATLLMLGGYFTDCLPVLYAFAAPMLVALFVTLQIKYMQEGLKSDG